MTLSLLIFLLITVLVPYINFSLQDSKPKKPLNRDIVAIAHRGSSQTLPENTMSAFQRALDENAEIIELDVHLSKDDSIIVVHDPNFKRTTGRDAEIGELTYEEIKTLNAAHSFGKGTAHESVPTLDQVLKLVQGRSKVLIELKWPKRGVYGNLTRKVMECIDANNASDWVIVQSFESLYLKEILEERSDITCHQLVFGWSNILPVHYDRRLRFGYFSPMEGIKSVNIFYMYLDRKKVEKLHHRNLTVYVFTLNEKGKIGKAINLGADGIISDNHLIVKEVLKNQ